MLLKSIEQDKKEVAKEDLQVPEIRGKSSIVGTVIIAVAGISRGVGCTHTAIAISNYIAKSGYGVALVEMNTNKHIAQIYDEGYEQGLLEKSFNIDGVDYYYNNSQDLINILSAGYKYIVLDLSLIRGIDDKRKSINNVNFMEMQRANKQILVGGIKDWQLNDFRIALGDEESINWNLYITLSDKDMFSKFKKEMHRNVFFAPYCPDPFKTYDEQDTAISNMLDDNNQKNFQVRKKGLFR